MYRAMHKLSQLVRTYSVGTESQPASEARHIIHYHQKTATIADSVSPQSRAIRGVNALDKSIQVGVDLEYVSIQQKLIIKRYSLLACYLSSFVHRTLNF